MRDGGARGRTGRERLTATGRSRGNTALAFARRTSVARQLGLRRRRRTSGFDNSTVSVGSRSSTTTSRSVPVGSSRSSVRCGQIRHSERPARRCCSNRASLRSNCRPRPRGLGPLDRRQVGVWLGGAELCGKPVKPQLVRGWWGPERIRDEGDVRRAGESALLRLPVEDDAVGSARCGSVRTGEHERSSGPARRRQPWTSGLTVHGTRYVWRAHRWTS